MRILLSLIALMFFSQSALACSCTVDAFTPEQSIKNIDRAEVIFGGVIKQVKGLNKFDGLPPEEITPSTNPNNSLITFEITSIYKGQITKDDMTIDAYIDTSTSCGYQPKENTQMFVMLYRFRGDLMVAGHCGSYITDNHLKDLKEKASLPPTKNIR